jgi:hypothetical protein
MQKIDWHKLAVEEVEKLEAKTSTHEGRKAFYKTSEGSNHAKARVVALGKLWARFDKLVRV